MSTPIPETVKHGFVQGRIVLSVGDDSDELAIKDAIEKLATLLGDNKTAGSIREWRSTVNNTYDAATIKALADVLIMQARQTRRIARQTLRLARLVTKDRSQVDVDTDI